MSDQKPSSNPGAGTSPSIPQLQTSQIQIAESALQARIREKLNHENIKLWTEPFILENQQKTPNDHEILALASRYAQELTLPESDIVESLFSLQKNSLDRLAEREHFKQTGLSTIRIKYSGFTTDAIKSGTTTSRLQVKLQQLTGLELKKMIGELINVNEKALKLICTGRVLDDNLLLDQQNLKNGCQVMVLSISTDHEAYQENESQFRQLEEAKGAADLLASRSIEDMYSLQIADQHGKTLDLPQEERKALAVGLVLHEKGRKSMKNGEFSKALVFLLEADNVYSRCQSKILENVDNFGMLNLDIAWSYLNLQSIAELPQTEYRLARCEEALHRSYGENMERLITLKGSSGWEAALYVRLHLLQGIAAYHQGQVEKSKFFMAKAEAELSRLRVSDDQLASLINLGYSPDEARMALRSTYGDIERAVDWIIRKREEQIRVRKEEAETIRLRKLQKRLGVTENGAPVNATFYKNMKEMGYESKLVLAALKSTNNDINSALQLVSDPMFISSVISNSETKLVTQSTSSGSGQGQSSSQSVPPTALTSGENNPFTNTMNQLRELLATMDGSSFPPDLEQILAEMGTGGAEVSERFRAFIEEQLEGSMGDVFAMRLRTVLSSIPNLPTAFKDLLEETLPDVAMTQEERERSKKAFNAISEDMGTEADYIDLGLSAETLYLEQYKGLLQM